MPRGKCLITAILNSLYFYQIRVVGVGYGQVKRPGGRLGLGREGRFLDNVG